MSHHHHPRPVGGALFDRTIFLLLAVFGAAAAVIVYRFFGGVGAVSNMNDGYTWGIWEPVNVVVFTGIGAGAYSVGCLCYLLNKGQYHPLVRPAVLLGAIAYTLGGASIVVALGRPWNIYLLALPALWNLSSVLLEVALCVTVYVTVLWIEMLPAVFEGAAASKQEALATTGKKWGARLAKAMPYIIALALLLPTMHQSSLGGLMMIAGSKVHPLWQTTLLPLLALISCLSMGLGAVVTLTAVMKRAWKAKHDQELLSDMSKVNAGLLLLFAVLRVGDIASSGKLALLAKADFYLLVFAVEMALFVIPAAIFLTKWVHHSRVRLAGAVMAVLGGAMYRVDAFLTCYDPGQAWHYVPSFGEITVTVGMAAIGAAVFIVVSRLFPVVVVQPTAEETGTPVPASVAAYVLAFPNREGTASVHGSGSEGTSRPAESVQAEDSAPAASSSGSGGPSRA